LWHGIREVRAMNAEEIDYVVGIILDWIERQLNDKRDSCVRICVRKTFQKLQKYGKSAMIWKLIVV